MRVKFIEISNPDEVEYKINWQIEYTEFPLTLNKEYTVYAIECTGKGRFINYFILDDSGSIYPNNYPSEFFEITDNKLSQYWENKNGMHLFNKSKLKCPELIAFKEWVENPFFEGDMIENNNDALKTFKKYKELIDVEYPDHSLPNAILISDNWVMCDYCEESWPITSKNGVIICPNCKRKSNNPFWSDKSPT